MPELTLSEAPVPTFGYRRPTTVDEAVAQKSAQPRTSRFWAGGTDLMLEWRRRQRSFQECIDLSRIDALRGIDVQADGVSIGALVTLDELDRARERCAELAFLARMAHVMCTVQTRTLATVGGNLVNASPAADLAPPLMCLDAVASLASPTGARELPVADLFAGPKQSAIGDDELLTHIELRRCGRRRAAFERIARTHVDIALALVACSLELDAGDRVARSRVALASVAPTPAVVDVSTMLDGRRLSELDEGLLDLVGGAVATRAAPIDDVRTTAAYRSRMVRVLTRRALVSAIRDFANGGSS